MSPTPLCRECMSELDLFWPPKDGLCVMCRFNDEWEMVPDYDACSSCGARDGEHTAGDCPGQGAYNPWE